MIKLTLLITFYLFLFTSSVNSKEFTVASYNVENLFDLKYDGTEYKEYKPHTKYWNQKYLDIKLTNISKTIKILNADIIALQEIESQRALELLSKKLPQYKYKYFFKNPQSSVGVAFFSKYNIIKTKSIPIDRFDKYARPILEVIIQIDNFKLKLYNNHWRSKKAKENTRTKYAVALKNYIFNLDKDDDYILLGDFNSNYNEWQTFKNNKKLNNTYGITGINHILNTIEDDKFILKENILNYDKPVHYNLWLELSKKDRFSYKFRKENGTPDNIILSSALFDNNKISYIDSSFKVFKPSFLYKNNKIKRWNKNKGYSDHLPIIASFTTSKVYKKNNSKVHKLQSNKINHIYNIEHITKPINLKDVVVIYKNKNNAIIKQPNNRAIYLYNCAANLQLGYNYNLTVEKIESYNGLLEIKEISKVVKKYKLNNYKTIYQDSNKINIFDTKYTNEIVTNLKGIYKNRYLYLNNGKKIRLYFPKKFKKPQENAKLLIVSGHLAIFKGQIQILIHKQSDIRIKND